jgi:hypothetical protein
MAGRQIFTQFRTRLTYANVMSSRSRMERVRPTAAAQEAPMHTTTLRTTLAVLAALAAFSMTGVASAGVERPGDAPPLKANPPTDAPGDPAGGETGENPDGEGSQNPDTDSPQTDTTGEEPSDPTGEEPPGGQEDTLEETPGTVSPDERTSPIEATVADETKGGSQGACNAVGNVLTAVTHAAMAANDEGDNAGAKDLLAAAGGMTKGGTSMGCTFSPTTGTIAKPNDGRYKRSAEALKKAHQRACADMKLLRDAGQDAMGDAFLAGDKEKGYDEDEKADRAEADAKKMGCSWAQ